MKLIAGFVVITLFFPLLFSASCDLNNPVPGPGDAGYVPSGWTEPELAYERSEYFPSRVVEYRQAPGQFAFHPDFNIEKNKSRLLGPPSGAGIYGADNSSVVSLGMAGGSVTLEFSPPLENHPDNIGGYDFIVFGNSFWSGGRPELPMSEAGIIEVMKDENGNNMPDDTWYLIPGSHISKSDSTINISYSLQWTEGGGTLFWDTVPAGQEGSHIFTATQPWWSGDLPDPDVFLTLRILSDEVYSGGLDFASVWGYADSAPTALRGDLDGDGVIRGEFDYPEIDPAFFYTVPDTHGDNIIDPGSAGGTAVDILWAVDSGFQPALLDEVSWIRISSASLSIHYFLGEYSCEVDGVSRVRRK